MSSCIEDALLNSQLPEQLFTFILNTTGIRHLDKVPGVLASHMIEDFKHNLSYYEQYAWTDSILNLNTNDVINSIFFDKTSIHKLLVKQDELLINFLETLVKNYKKYKDGFIIRRMLYTGVQKIIDFNHNVEPIVILKEHGKLTIADGLHRILSLFIENKTESVMIKAWVGVK